MITRDEAAAKLDGNQYREEGSREFFKELKEAGLVAVFGASDDLMEFRGAIYDEIGAYNGGTAYLTNEGLLQSKCEEGEDCPYFKQLLGKASTITAIWDRDGFSFQYETEIPHSTFVIMEDDDTYCKGIVFALADAA